MGSLFSAPKQAPRCTYTTSIRCLGERRSGGPFWEVLSIIYSYANCSCSLEISQKGIAKRVDSLCVTLLDKDNGTNVVVDADVVVTANTSPSRAYSTCSRMTVRNCNLAPHKGVLENWSQSFNSVEAIRYFTPRRHGMFSLTTPNIPNKNNADNVNGGGTITHHFATEDSDDAGFGVEVKFKVEASKGLRVHVDGPKFRPNICFADHIREVEVVQGDGDGHAGDSRPVIYTSLPPPEAQDGHGGGTPNPNSTNTQHSHSHVQPLNRTSLPKAQDGRGASSLASVGSEGFRLMEKLYGPRPQNGYPHRGTVMNSGAPMCSQEAAHMYGGVHIVYMENRRRVI